MMINEEKPDRWFENVTLSDLKLTVGSKDERGTIRNCYHVSEILGRDVFKVVYKDLRAICAKLGVHGYKNKKKDVLLELMAAKKMNQAACDEVSQSNGEVRTTKEETQCQFRLLNILFSDAYAERLARIEDTSRPLRDSGELSEKAFWSDVQATFVDESVDENVSKVQFEHPAFADMDIDPSIFVHHDWKKLQDIFYETNNAYQTCLAISCSSGTHTYDFYSLCRGKLNVVYLHLHLQKKPWLNEALEHNLPEGVFMESEGEYAYKESPKRPSLSKKKRPRENAEVQENILNSPMLCESNTQSNKLVEYRNEMIRRQTELKEMEEQRQEREEQRQERDEQRKEREEQRKDEQEKRMKVLHEYKLVRYCLKHLKHFNQMCDRLSALQKKLKKEKDERQLELLTLQISVQQGGITSLLKSGYLEIKRIN